MNRVATRWSRSIDGPSRTFEGDWEIYHCVDLTGYRLPASMRGPEAQKPEAVPTPIHAAEGAA